MKTKGNKGERSGCGFKRADNSGRSHNGNALCLDHESGHIVCTHGDIHGAKCAHTLVSVYKNGEI